MALEITIDRVDRTPTGGFVISTSRGDGIEASTVEELQGQVAELFDFNLLLKVAVAHFLAKSPDGSDDSKIEGKTFTYDPAQNLAIIQVS